MRQCADQKASLCDDGLTLVDWYWWVVWDLRLDVWLVHAQSIKLDKGKLTFLWMIMKSNW